MSYLLIPTRYSRISSYCGSRMKVATLTVLRYPQAHEQMLQVFTQGERDSKEEIRVRVDVCTAHLTTQNDGLSGLWESTTFETRKSGIREKN